MRRSLAILVLSVAAGMALPSEANAARRYCGTIGSGLDRLHVRVVSGPAGCAEARKVVRAFSGDAAGRIGKWRCDGGAGGFGCVKSRPRSRITATIR